MPFDNTNARGTSAVKAIDLMLKEFNDGKGWICDSWHDDDTQQRCLLSALTSVRMRNKIHKDGTANYLRAAIKEAGFTGSIPNFNDCYRRHAKDRYHTVIEPMLQRAKELAETDI